MNLSAMFAAGLLCLATAAPVAAHTAVYRADMDGASEALPNPSLGTGWARVTIDFDLLTMHVEASFKHLSGTTTAAHVHCCTLAANTGTAGVATQTPSFGGFPLGVTAGSYDAIFDMTQAASYNAGFIGGGTIDDAFTALTNGMKDEKSYFNIHSSLYGGGEIRGFLHPVPEPATAALAALGLGAISLAARRRRVA